MKIGGIVGVYRGNMMESFPLIALISATARSAHWPFGPRTYRRLLSILEHPGQIPLTLHLSRAFEPTALLGKRVKKYSLFFLRCSRLNSRRYALKYTEIFFALSDG